MIKLLHFFLFKRIILTGPLHQGQYRFILAPVNFGSQFNNIQSNNKLKSNKLIN